MYRHLLIVVNDHPSSRVAVEHGVDLARSLNARVSFVHVLPREHVAVTDLPPVVTLAPDTFAQEASRQAGQLLDAALVVAARSAVIATKVVLDVPNPVDGIASQARDQGCDLIIVGTEGGNALVRLLTGSCVPGLITRAGVPVLVCHATDPLPSSP